MQRWIFVQSELLSDLCWTVNIPTGKIELSTLLNYEHEPLKSAKNRDLFRSDELRTKFFLQPCEMLPESGQCLLGTFRNAASRTTDFIHASVKE